jgi:hypothetical protein
VDLRGHYLNRRNQEKRDLVSVSSALSDALAPFGREPFDVGNLDVEMHPVLRRLRFRTRWSKSFSPTPFAGMSKGIRCIEDEP